ncbi:MAG: GGDEF domain-containing protein [Candidatus Nanopelagicales bacterium]
MLDITERTNADEELRRRDAELARLIDELVRQAATDTPTGVATRRHFYDCLKRVNDTGGHARGDHVLVGFAAILDDQCRREDLAGRLGGDEFSVAVPGVGSGGAQTWPSTAAATRWAGFRLPDRASGRVPAYP